MISNRCFGVVKKVLYREGSLYYNKYVEEMTWELSKVLVFQHRLPGVNIHNMFMKPMSREICQQHEEREGVEN